MEKSSLAFLRAKSSFYHGVSESRLRSRKAGEGHAQWGAGHVVDAHVVEEVDRVGVAPVLSANPKLHARVHVPPALYCRADQLAHPHRIDRLEGVTGQEALRKPTCRFIDHADTFLKVRSGHRPKHVEQSHTQKHACV